MSAGQVFTQMGVVNLQPQEQQTFDDLISVLLMEQEPMEVDRSCDSLSKEQRQGNQNFKEFDELRALFFIQDGGGDEAGGLMSPDVEKAALVRVTDEPQLLNQSGFHKPWEQDQPSSPCSGEASSTTTDISSSEPSCEAGNLEEKVAVIKLMLGNYDKIVEANGANGKIQVHQVVHLLLLSTVISALCIKLNLPKLMAFCDEYGKENNKHSNHFRVVDTKAMGLVWQIIKQNRNGNYDTFARAMRVGRERQKEYFVYLESGKGSKKRIYKLGDKSMLEMRRMEKLILEGKI